MKVRSVAVELFHADGRTDMTKLISAFRNFANAPKNGDGYRCICCIECNIQHAGLR